MHESNSESALQAATVTHLLHQVKILHHYEEKLSQGSGEKFNIFDILGYSEDTHSRLLSALLDPHGSHGKGSIFLKFFVDALEIEDFDYENARVRREVNIGPRTKISGGRIDIVISTSNRKSIFIENKLFAMEQENQLQRYHAHDQNAYIVFLTPDGALPKTLPPETSILRCISYRTHIVNWLKNCRSETATIPNVREIITHYIHIIQKFTAQNTNNQMNKEIINAVLKDKESYSAFVALSNARGEIRNHLISLLSKQLHAEASLLGLEVVGEFSAKGERCEGFYVTTPALAASNIQIGIEFEGQDYSGLFFGIARIHQNQPSLWKQCILNYYKERFHQGKGTDDWPVWTYWNDGPYFRPNGDPLGDIISGELVQESLVPLFKDLMAIAERAIAASPAPFSSERNSS